MAKFSKDSSRNKRKNCLLKEDKDIFLLVVLSILNVGSGYTTIQGALRIVPGIIGYGIGGTIQLILFILLSGLGAKHAPLRKWFAALVFAFLSIYTSFFTYYANLTEGSQKKIAYAQAKIAHDKLVGDVYTPMLHELEQLRDKAKEYDRLAKEEANGGGVTGLVGVGEKTKEYRKKSRDLKLEASQLESRVKVLKEKFEYPVENLTPEAIFNRDSQALAAVPPEWRKNYTQLKRSDYIDEEVEILLLAPYYKIVKGEVPAIVSLFLAITMDGVIIVLGTAIDKKSKISPIDITGQSIATVISKLKGAGLTVIGAIQKPGIPILRPNQRSGLDNAVNIVTLRLKGRGSMFLQEFYEAIDAETYQIDFERLQTNANSTFALSFRVLLDLLRNPSLGWIILQDGKWSVAKDSYSILTYWLNEEIVRQCREESGLGDIPETWSLERDVPFAMPIFSYK